MLLAAWGSKGINSAWDSDGAAAIAGGCSAECSESEDKSPSSDAAIDFVSSPGASNEILGQTLWWDRPCRLYDQKNRTG